MQALGVMVVIGMYAVIYFEMKKCCAKINPAPPPNCQCEPGSACGCNHPVGPEFVRLCDPAPAPPGNPLVLTDEAGVGYYDVSTNSWVDPISGMQELLFMQTSLQSSTNLIQWQEEYAVTGWGSPSGWLFVFSRNGVPLATNYAVGTFTNSVPIPLGNRIENKRFFRLATP